MWGRTILARYVCAAVVRNVGLVLLLLLALLLLFELIAELEHLGPGDYDVAAALLYVALGVPRLCYELFPAAALIGTLLALSALARTGELAILRVAGISKSGLVRTILPAGMMFVMLSAALGELAAPEAEVFADAWRSTKRIGRIALGTRTGIWIRDGDTYINVRQVLPGNVIRYVHIYEFDADKQLRRSSLVASARYESGRWLLEDAVTTRIDGLTVSSAREGAAAWESLMSPALIEVLTSRDPDHLSVVALYRFVDYLEANNLDSAGYRYAMWAKVVYPAATAIMVLLALPMVLGNLTRAGGAGRSVFFGTLIGLSFSIVNKVFGNFASVTAVSPLLSALLPTLAVGLFAVWWLRRIA